MNKGVSLAGVAAGYGKRVVVDGVTCDINPGEITCLIGPNGSGKSTILKTITRQLNKIDGEVFMLGDNMDSLRDTDISKRMSMVTTGKNEPELMSVREVVETGRYPYTGRLGILSEYDRKKVDEAIGLVRAKDIEQSQFTDISDGQRQRIMLARAICQEPKILVLDEPTSYLDMGFKIDILTIISDIARKENVAVVMSMHELELAVRVADRIGLINDGKLECFGTTEEVFGSLDYKSVYNITDGDYNAVTGQVALKKPQGEPSIFVIGGGGSGLMTYFKLQRLNKPFFCGIISEIDREYEAAKALCTKGVFTGPFEEVGESDLQKAKDMIDRCDSVYCTVTSFGKLNEYNKELRDYALARGKLTE